MPNRPYILCHRLPPPAFALSSSSSWTLTPYCCIQHVKPLFFTATGGSPFPSLAAAHEFASRSARVERFDLKETSRGRSEVSSSLSAVVGMSPPGRGGGEDGMRSESRDEGRWTWDFIIGFFGRAADFRSSRSPHSLKSCSFNWASKSGLLRRLLIIS